MTYHLGYALAELGYKTLLVDLDPQSNLTLFGLDPEALHKIWRTEEAFIDDFVQAREGKSQSKFEEIAHDVRSIHCMPDMFSLYGIQNIGKSLKTWKRDFDTIFNLLSHAKLSHFPKNFVSFLGFTVNSMI